MGITLGSNIASLKVQRRLNESSSNVSTTYGRLASGLRIEKAADDAAGLSVASQLNASKRVYAQGIKNISDAVSAVTIAQGAAQNLSSIIIRIQELAEQSANGVYTARQREALDNEAQSLRNEFNRITATTKFNGLSLLSSTSTDVQIQAGGNLGGPLNLSLKLDPLLNSPTALSLDGVDDLVAVSGNSSLDYTGGELTIEAWIKPDAADPDGVILSQPWNNSNQYNYALLYNSGVITFVLGGDTTSFLAAGTASATAGSWHHVAATVDKNGTMRLFVDGTAAGSQASGITSFIPSLGDENRDLAIGSVFPYPEGSSPAAAFQFQGAIDEVRISNTIRYQGNFTPLTTPLVSDSSTRLLLHFDEAQGTKILDSSGNGLIGTLRNGAKFAAGNIDDDFTLGQFSLQNENSSRATLDLLQAGLSAYVGTLGAQESRLLVAKNQLAVLRENYALAESRIMDADIADESSQLIKNQILQKIGASILAQANQAPNLALLLLRGS